MFLGCNLPNHCLWSKDYTLNWPYSSLVGNSRLTATRHLIHVYKNILYVFSSVVGYVQQFKDKLNIV